jgi:hypothetical protein
MEKYYSKDGKYVSGNVLTLGELKKLEEVRLSIYYIGM